MGLRNVRIRDNRTILMDAIRRGAVKGIRDSADRIVELAKDRVPVSTGNLERSIQAKPVRSSLTRVSAEFGAYSGYAAAVEFGTAGQGEPFGSAYISPVGADDWPLIPPGKKRFGPYKIRPRPPRRALRWVDNHGVHFAREVTHPGIQSQPYMRPAVDIVRHREAPRILRERIQGEIRRALKPRDTRKPGGAGGR
jgi:hypothetical protein